MMYLFLIIFHIFLGGCNIILRLFSNAINFVTDAINNYILHRNNRFNRGVKEQPLTKYSDMFNNINSDDNVIISGGEKTNRANLLTEAVVKTNKQLPIIILHESDTYLENKVKSSLSSAAVVINKKNPTYNPFVNLSYNQIEKIIYDVAKNEFNLTYKAGYTIRAICDIIRLLGQKPSLGIFSTCPFYNTLFDKVQILFDKGIINHDKLDELKSNLLKGQDEFSALEAFFQNLKFQARHIIVKNSSNYIDIINQMHNNKVILIDINSSENKLLINTILSQLNLVNKKYCIMLDNVSINDNQDLLKIISNKTDKRTVVLSSSDIYANICDSNTNLFSTLVGNSKMNLIMKHYSASSSQSWSDLIGNYEKIETDKTYSQGKSNGGIFLFPTYNSNSSTHFYTRKEEILKPQVIQKLNENEIYIFSENNIVHTHICEN